MGGVLPRAVLSRISLLKNRMVSLEQYGDAAEDPYDELVARAWRKYEERLRRTHTVWISARPEEHMSRVMKQGDFRPMARNREAMADLHAILDARRTDYARAEATLDTSGASVPQSFAKLVKLVAPWTKG